MTHTPIIPADLAVPDNWKAVLSSVQDYFPEAIIAGGALRDLWHDKPAKDVDIFIPVRGESQSNLYEYEILMIDPYAEKIAASLYGQSGNTATPGFRNIHVIWRMTIDNVIYEVIFIEDRGESIIDVFDLSIAQIGFNGKAIFYSPNFSATINDGVIRVCNVNRSDRQTNRIERVLSKYPEYRIEEEVTPW